MSSEDSERVLYDPEFQRRARLIVRHALRGLNLPGSVTEDDVYQTVMMKMLLFLQRQGDQGRREIENPHAFVFIVARNEARRLFSKEKRHSHLSLDDPATVSISDPSEDAQSIESGTLLREIRAHLDDEERHLLDLWINGFTYRQMAAVMGVSHVTMKNRISRIIEKIREHLFGAGGIERERTG